jgi:phosphoglycerate dehydrogenase-like enzyme
MRVNRDTNGAPSHALPPRSTRAGGTVGAALALATIAIVTASWAAPAGTATLLAAPTAATAPSPAGTAGTDEAQALAEAYGLRLGAEPVSVRPGWRKPRLIVVEAVPGLEAAVRSAAPGVTVVAASSTAEMVAAVRGADAVIGRANWICSDAVLAAGAELRWLQTMTAGVEACTAKPAVAQGRYVLTNMRAIAAPMIAEHTLGMLLALTRGLTVSLPRQATGEWSQQYPGVPLVSVQGKTMLVAGLGGIGGEIAKRAHALGMRVIATRGSSRDRPPYVEYVGLSDELPTLLGQADVVVDALPLTAATRGLFDARAFARMRPGAYFLNVGRGATVVTDDLVAALQSRRLAGAGLDVTAPEPLPATHPLWRAPNVVITPHNSSDADLGVETQLRVLRENLRRYLAGDRLLSVVEVARGY